MTGGAGTTSAWVVPGTWPGSGVNVVSSVVSQRSLFSDFLCVRDLSEVLPDGGTENTKAVVVPTGTDVFSTISGGTVVLARTSSFYGISACTIDGETIFLATVPHFDPEILGVVSSACWGLAVSGAVLVVESNSV